VVELGDGVVVVAMVVVDVTVTAGWVASATPQAADARQRMTDKATRRISRNGIGKLEANCGSEFVDR
jgi:hypothetical protein